MKNLIDRFDIERIARLYDAQEYADCLHQVKKVCERLGGSTPYLSWLRGVCMDMTGEMYSGLLHFKEALQGDPYNYFYISSLNTSLSRFRSALLACLEDEGTLEDVKEMHSFLVQAGEFTSTHQYLVIKNYVKRGLYKEAHELLTVYLMNNPHDADALEMEKVVEKSSGTRMAS